ncbi:MAG: ribosome biogenesis GTPase YlqF [Oscillospiraceae bacterium]|nr:ribosome biogenesis GTPase YlqF [Oscillospiraceae bacterium]
MNIQWYPGHMAKTRRQMEKDLGEVDALIELADARIVRASRNPDLDSLAEGKPRLLVLSRADLADPLRTSQWREVIPGLIECVCHKPGAEKTIVPAIRRILSDKISKYALKGQSGRALRLMVTGIPNVGKSTLINTLARRKAAKAENRPGVTRERQWFPVDNGLMLMDTPGLLWPKFEDPAVGMLLAFTGAVRDEIIDLESLAAELCVCLARLYPQLFQERYKIIPSGQGHEILEAIARKRGFLISGGECDSERASRTVLDEFRSGKLGRISLEVPGEEPIVQKGGHIKQ